MLDMFDLIHYVHWTESFFKWRLYCLMQTGGGGEVVAEEGDSD